MKYVVVLVDGMADYPIKELQDRTPLEVADIPMIDLMAKHGEIGMVQTVPVGMAPGSDTANLAVMGYPPRQYHTGRSPLEAASIGVTLKNTDVTFRCNLVTLAGSGAYETKKMVDHSSGDITTEEAEILLSAVKERFETEDHKFYKGVSYRHLLVWNNGTTQVELTPPHDILEKEIRDFLPKGELSDWIRDMMIASFDVLDNHPINLKRKERGLNPANSIWLWGEGVKPQLDNFYDKYGLKGSVISAVDLINGIGILAGLRVISVSGATGTLHTNFKGKAQAAIDALMGGDDYCYIHLEAPDECGHQGDLEGKIKSIELIDDQVVKPIVDALKDADEDLRMLIVPDHRTPIALRTHTSEPVPYVLYDSRSKEVHETNAFSETAAQKYGNFIPSGPELLNKLLQK
ncbi:MULTISPECIES: cofactor-independent phosphoglycerate mutase [unclassified Fusibacter]|uniref:cofactor-independent phosphoglycerate mutase n=1 Tax=unclassified Fusibacter TaxID=2624464 RepID=UPI00101107B6|nr:MULTISPECIES: cofactor-independent phosphoglycerate mutase [unclassified Fusibacter]MCK8060478.1 cofactor-independent phosphoglycerate mutase [Fusibacter sp. A2]NPE20233.1 cofactor-independent phosphoglycerate mutase [Fusibacter sp. A1]RXV63441.1 cofactor-independent phosphoglycerate mutase [Fusibacter sp. A1]